MRACAAARPACTAGMIIALDRLFHQPTVGIVVGQFQGVRNCVVHHEVRGRKSLKPGAVGVLAWAGKIGAARSASGAIWPLNYQARNPEHANAYARARHALNAFGWSAFDQLVIRLRRLPEGEHAFSIELDRSGGSFLVGAFSTPPRRTRRAGGQAARGADHR